MQEKKKTKYANRLAITHFKLPLKKKKKKNSRGKNEIYPNNEQIFASIFLTLDRCIVAKY